MTSASPDLIAAMRLVDELIDCRAQLSVCTSISRRAELESAMRARADRIWAYLDDAENAGLRQQVA